MHFRNIFILVSSFIIFSCKGPGLSDKPAKFEGRHTCVDCHSAEHELFANSHHDQAMMPPTDENVLGDFNNVTFQYYEDTARFYKKEGDYYIYCKGKNGTYEEFKITYVLAWTPLQQYIVEFPAGHYQMLPYCWDTRSKAEGGQRWFHLYPDEYIKHDDVLYWTGQLMNFNYMCAECHTTNLQKNYDLSTHSYNTTWTEIDVSCESCHGPGSVHNEWAELNQRDRAPEDVKNYGLIYKLKEEPVNWVFDREKGNAYRDKPRKDHTQVEMCARCHSRRFQFWGEYEYGQPLLNTHLLDLLTPELYHFDGQIKDEDYVYGSFIQSKMYHEGVTCTDCHDPHSLKISSYDNTLCTRCHLTSEYNTREHHFHDPDSAGALCYTCHMPENTYMVVDPRRDHSIRIPRPDLSVSTGVPNACNKCHADESVEWADEHFREWYGDKYDTIYHYGQTFHAAYNEDKSAKHQLLKIISDDSYPAIVRASAITYLARFFPANMQETIAGFLKDPAPLVRVSALRALQNYNLSGLTQHLFPLLKDPIRAARIELMRLLVSVPSQYIPAEYKESYNKTLEEYMRSTMFTTDQAGSNINMGVLYAAKNQPAEAEKFYKNALHIDSNSVAAYINLADLYRTTNQDKKGEAILKEAIQKIPENGDLRFSYGLLLVRQGKNENSLQEFRKAIELQPLNPRYHYVYGVALFSTGQKKKAINHLEKATEDFPENQEILLALASYHNQLGNIQKAKAYAKRIIEIYPENSQAKSLLNNLNSN